MPVCGWNLCNWYIVGPQGQLAGKLKKTIRGSPKTVRGCSASTALPYLDLDHLSSTVCQPTVSADYGTTGRDTDNGNVLMEAVSERVGTEFSYMRV
jgi:hypothetical protein